MANEWYVHSIRKMRKSSIVNMYVAVTEPLSSTSTMSPATTAQCNPILDPEHNCNKFEIFNLANQVTLCSTATERGAINHMTSALM